MDDVIYLDILGEEFKLFKRQSRTIKFHILCDFEIKNLYLLFNYRSNTIYGEILYYILEDKLIKVITSYKETFFVTNKDIISIGTKEQIERNLIFL